VLGPWPSGLVLLQSLSLRGLRPDAFSVTVARRFQPEDLLVQLGCHPEKLGFLLKLW
jgi:hypothetical protein